MMEFLKELDQFVESLKSKKDSIATEEATKTALIMPLFSLLGYDVFDPLEFVPEYITDFGMKKGEKVDYAIFKDGEPVILVEAKSVNQKLSKYSGQLYRYFSNTKAKFAILTNGIQYRFYTDLDKPNLMDPVPFNQIDLLNLKPSQIDDLLKFHKKSFDVTSLLDSASSLKCKRDFKQLFADQLEDPSDEFLKLFLQEIYQGVKTQSVIARYKPILKQAMGEFVNELMNEKIKAALNATNGVSSAATLAVGQREPEEITQASQPELTELEKQAFDKFRLMFTRYIDLESITYKKTESYVTFLFQNNTRKWISRLIINGNTITLILPDSDKQDIRCRISNLNEMENYRPYMMCVLSRYTNLLLPFDSANIKVYTINFTRRCAVKK